MDAPSSPPIQVSVQAPQSIPAQPDVRRFRPISLRTSAIGHFHAQGRLNGQPVEIIIDTGAAGTVVDRQWAEARNLTLVPMNETGGGVGGGAMALARVDGAQLELEGVPLSDAQIVAIDLSSVTQQLKARGVTPPQVIVGGDILKRWRAVIDYATSTMWLAPA